jgi:predicted amidohydrolase
MSGLRIHAAQCATHAGDVDGNLRRLIAVHAKGRAAGADLVVTPRLSLSGAATPDLASRAAFVAACRAGLDALAAATAEGPALAVGLPWSERGHVFDAVAVLEGGSARAMRFAATVDPAEGFAAGPMPGPVAVRGMRIGFPVGDDLGSEEVVECLQETGAELLISPARTAFATLGAEARLQRAIARVVESDLPILLVEAAGAEGTLVFDGGSFALDAERKLAWRAARFAEAHATLAFDGDGAFKPAELAPDDDPAEDVPRALRAALSGLLDGGPWTRLAVPLGEGLDDGRVLALAIAAVGRERVVALPFGSGAAAIVAGMGLGHGVPIADSDVSRAMERCLREAGIPADLQSRSLARAALIDGAMASGELAVLAPATILTANRLEARRGTLAPVLGLGGDALAALAARDGVGLRDDRRLFAAAIRRLASGAVTRGDLVADGMEPALAAEAAGIAEEAADFTGGAPALRLDADPWLACPPRALTRRFRDAGLYRAASGTPGPAFQPRVDAIDF